MPTTESSYSARRLRVAILWPHPRWERIRRRFKDPAQHEEMDGLSYLEESGIEPVVVDSSPAWLNPMAKRGSLWSGVDPVRFLRLMAAYWKYDLVLSIDSSSACLFVLCKRLLRLRKPVLVIDPALDPNYRWRMKMHSLVLPHVQEVIVFGEIQVRFLRERFGSVVQARLIRHRMDTEFYDPDLAPAPGLAASLVVSVGSDIGRDYACLVRASDGLGARVLVHTRKAIAGPLPENVHVQRSWLTEQQLRELYAAASIVAVPLQRTIHPSGINALLEAMSMGKAVVVSASPGVTDYVEDGKTALVVEPGDPGAMHAALNRLLADGELRERLGRNARQYCQEQCAMPVYAKQVAESIRRCVEARGGSAVGA
ncbi:MAG: glycosyltransferase family 4 protein [Acidobacteria bacterium]|nr:glycosyltransferase family 4 protein [Acidobacteriota bacterium]